MSLKKFHILFILITSLFMIYFSYWSLDKWMNYSDTAYLFYFSIGVCSFIFLLYYSKKFISKYKGVVS